MKEKLLELARENKISAVGICGIDSYMEKSKGLLDKASFCATGDIADNIKSVIVCAFSYYAGEQKGNVSRYARGIDYHMVAKEKMEYLCEFLRDSGFIAEAYADTGTLNERLLASLSGIAFIGRNRMAINEKLGSYFFIGYILTDCKLPCDIPNTNTCKNCGKCIAACPLGALSQDGFCEEKCLSYITQKKGELSETEQEAIRKTKTIWGCDICQEVCPHNNGMVITDIEEFKENLIPDLLVNENITNKEFKKIYGNRAFSWRGKGVISRNQKIIL